MFGWKRDSDARLVAGVLAGRQELFGALVERYLPVVRSIAYARLRNVGDVDDVAQETFLRAYQQLDQLRERQKFGPWVAAIARNVSVGAVHHRCREQASAPDATDDAFHIPDFAASEIFRAVRAQVEALDSDIREVMSLHYFGGKTSREIGAILELSDAAVRKRLQRGRAAVGDRLLRRFDVDDLRGAMNTKDAARRIVGVVAAAGATWQGAAAAGLTVGASGTAALLAVGGASKAVIALVSILGLCGGMLVWVNSERGEAPSPEPAREWTTAQVQAQASEPPVRVEPPGGDPAGIPVSGRVLGTDGTAIPGATVKGYYRQLDQKVIELEAVSDDAGEYRFYLELPWGSVWVEPSKAGYVSPAGVRGKVTQEGLSGLDCTLLREAVVEGVVVDGRGNRLPAMPVSAHLYTGGRHVEEVGAESGAQGGFRLGGLLPGEHGLAVLKADEYHELLEVQRVGLSDGEVKTGIRLVYDGPGLVIAGRVVDPLDRPIVGAQFYTMEDRQTRSDESGAFRMERMQEGTIVLHVNHKHYQTLETAVESGKDDVTLVMQPLGSVSGVVVDGETKAPVSDFEIQASGGTYSSLDRYGLFKLTTVSDPEGRFRLDGLKHETVTLFVRAENYAMTLKTVSTPAGEALEDVVMELAPGATLRGRVVGKEGGGVAGASVFLGASRGRSDSSLGQWAVSDVDGNFAIAGMPLARHKLSAYHADHGKGEAFVDLSHGPKDERIVIALETGGTIRGTVWRDGRAAPGVQVSATDVDGTGPAFSETTSGDDGRYVLEMVPEGTVGVRAWLNHPSLPMAGRHHVQPAEVQEGQTTEVDIDVTEGTGTIEGEVVWNGAGEFRGHANVVVTKGAVRDKLFAPCKNGRIYVESVPAGRASILVYLAVGDPTVEGAVHGTIARQVETDVKAGETSYVTVSFTGKGVVEGAVAGVESGEWCNIVALEGVVAVPDVSPGTRQGFQDAIRGNAGMDATGRYRIEGLEPGTYTLLAQAAELGNGIGIPEEVRFSTAVVTVGDDGAAVADFDMR